MNAFQACRNTSDAVPLYLPQKLYLKPAAKISITIQLPNVKKLEKSISHWEIMEKLRLLIRPDEFSVLKVSKTTVEFVKFEAEIENRTRLDKVLSKLNNNSIKLKEIPSLIRVKASEPKSDFPTRHKWDAFFQESRDMDEMKPGERPDTIHIWNLPIKWFVSHHMMNDEDATPSEKILYRIFEKFGSIRYVDVPICDVYRKKMKDHISGMRAHAFDDKEFFEGYIQFKDYIGFTKAMDALKGMKLMKKEEDEALCVDMKVDFDRTKHLTDASIRRREIVRDRLVKKQRDKEEKEKREFDQQKKKEQNERQKEINAKSEKERRRREREEKRKKKILDKLKISGCDELNDKIAKEEKKLLKVQRKLEAIRLVEELFHRIKDKRDELHINNKTTSSGGDELKRYKDMSELAVLTQRQKLHNAIEGRVVLKSILAGKHKKRSKSSSSDSSVHEEKPRDVIPSDMIYDANWYTYSYPPPIYPSPIRGHFPFYSPRGHGNSRTPVAGPSRGRHYPRSRGYRSRFRGGYRNYGSYPPDVEEEYIKYFSKFYSEHDDRKSRSRSRSRSYSRSRSRRRSRSRSYSRSRSRGRRSRSYSSSSRSRSHKRTKRRSESHFTPSPVSNRKKAKTKTRSRSLSIDSSKFKSPRSVRRMRRASRSKSWSLPHSDRASRSLSKSPETKKTKK